jgi:hypothetical protein
MSAQKESLKQIYQRYYPQGFVQAGELLMHPHLALQLSVELEKAGVVTLGCGYWSKLGSNQFMESPGYDVPQEVLNAEDAVPRSWQMVREDMINNMPLHATLVSFINDIPLDWDLYPGYR